MNDATSECGDFLLITYASLLPGPSTVCFLLSCWLCVGTMNNAMKMNSNDEKWEDKEPVAGLSAASSCIKFSLCLDKDEKLP